MEKVTEYQSELFSDMKKLYDEMLINLFEVDKFGPLAKDNFLKKLTLFNKNLEIIKYNIKDLLIDLKMNDCQLSETEKVMIYFNYCPGNPLGPLGPFGPGGPLLFRNCI